MNPLEFRGPEFLFFFAVLSVIVLILTSLIRKIIDGSENPALQSPQSLVSDPYLIAQLRGGAEETLKLAAMSLIDRGLLKVESDGKLVAAPNVRAGHARRPVEQAVIDLYQKHGSVSSLRSLKSKTAEFDERLKSLGLIPDGAMKAKRWMLFLVMLFLLEGMAVAKIMIGLSRGRPVGFLMVMAVVAFLFLWTIAHDRVTRHGDKFLASVKRLFAGLKDRADSIHQGGASADLALLAAVFGITAVPLSAFPYKATFLPPPSTSSSSSSSCSSSSCSSSSCGGGGCGGGCGGCGS